MHPTAVFFLVSGVLSHHMFPWHSSLAKYARRMTEEKKCFFMITVTAMRLWFCFCFCSPLTLRLSGFYVLLRTPTTFDHATGDWRAVGKHFICIKIQVYHYRYAWRCRRLAISCAWAMDLWNSGLITWCCTVAAWFAVPQCDDWVQYGMVTPIFLWFVYRAMIL